MRHFILTFLFCCLTTLFVSAQTTVSLLILPEGNSTGDGTYLGTTSYSTQPCGAKSFALEHHFYGSINSSINFYRGGSVTGGFLTFSTNDNNEKMRIDANGYVGIGTTAPFGKLDITGGNLIVNRPANKVDNNGISEFSAFEINNSFAIGQTGYVQAYYPSYNNLLFGADYDGHIGGVQPNIQFGRRGSPFLTIINNGTNTGNIGIGTTTPDQALTVKGKIHANEVIIDLNGPIADYVFKPTYNLMPLHEVEQFVKTNNHLPEIPSAEEVSEKGMSVGEMQNKLLKKVEELTLYSIEQEKKYNALLKKMDAVAKLIEEKLNDFRE